MFEKTKLTLLLAAVVGTCHRVASAETEPVDSPASSRVVEFRYTPAGRQTSIGLPDDWEKTLVAQDGGLLYDAGGRYAGFKIKITPGLAGRCEWVRQELHSPRVPIVKTVVRSGPIEVVGEVFAVAPRLEFQPKPGASVVVLERVGNHTGLTNWASPTPELDAAFCNIAVGWREPVRYRFKSEPNGRYTVAFGLCEGHHTSAGQRLLDLQVEGKTRQKVDMVATKGHNVPAVFAFDAADENGDGWVEVGVAPSAGTPDDNTILNVLWVFRQGTAPPAEELLRGRGVQEALAHVDCGNEQPPGPGRLAVQRIGNPTGLLGWASPPAAVCDPAFRNIAVGWNEPVRYRFRTAPTDRYTVLFGLCEGHHASARERILDLQIEGKTRQTVDMIAAKGRNIPAVFGFDARDENGDGWIDLTVAAAKGSPDTNAILNVLWVFREGSAPSPGDVLSGRSPQPALAHLDCGGEADVPGPPRHDMILLRVRNTGTIAVRCIPSLTIESECNVSPEPAARRVRIGPYTTLISAERFEALTRSDGVPILHLSPVSLPPGKERGLALCVVRGRWDEPVPVTWPEALAARKRAEEYWQKLNGGSERHR